MTTGAGRTWQVVGPDGRPYGSARPGMLGGNRRGRIYARLDCRAALRALARGGYRAYRVFFLDEATAIAAGYRPCAVCMPRQYRRWRAGRVNCLMLTLIGYENLDSRLRRCARDVRIRVQDPWADGMR